MPSPKLLSSISVSQLFESFEVVLAYVSSSLLVYSFEVVRVFVSLSVSSVGFLFSLDAGISLKAWGDDSRGTIFRNACSKSFDKNDVSIVESLKSVF